MWKIVTKGHPKRALCEAAQSARDRGKEERVGGKESGRTTAKRWKVRDERAERARGGIHSDDMLATRTLRRVSPEPPREC